MRLSYRWLLGMLGFEVPFEELLHRLVMNGLEVESVTDLGVQSGKIITGRILEIRQHPNAENLVLCRVDAGGPEPLHIVCGAKNMAEGDFVPVAIEGAHLPNGLTIKKSKIRGEVSQGMMCSGRELGWSEDHAGLLILPRDGQTYRIGESFDAQIETKITPNRPDCLSVYGIARDVAAALGKPLAGYPPHEPREGGAPAAEAARVRVEAPNGCPRYMGRVIRGVRIGPSPLWLQRAIESAGLRPINNVVDVTNYIMTELGQPLHAFDLDRVARHEIIIRLAREGEEVTTLDGQTHKLVSTDLLITDPEKPIALAGIMGCGNSEITGETVNVFLEGAYFTPATIRRTSKRLAKSTDSSYRFERGMDWEHLPVFVDRAARLIAEVAGGEVAPGVFDEGQPIAPPEAIRLNVARVNTLTGLSLPREEICAILRGLGFGAADQGEDIEVRVPAWRPDVAREADLAEEIVRIYGYEKIPSVLPPIVTHAPEDVPEDRLADVLRRQFQQAGFMEVTNYSFLAAEALARLGFNPAEAVRLKNPLSAEYAVLRTSIMPGLLESVRHNQNRDNLDLRLFEVGKVFGRVAVTAAAPQPGAPGETQTGVAERWQFAAAITGTGADPSWRMPAKAADFYEAKAAAELVFAGLGVSDCAWLRPADLGERAHPAHWLLHPGKSAVAQDEEGEILLAVGELHPRLRESLELKRTAVLVFGEFKPLQAYLDRRPKYKEVPVFPSVSRDLALVADRDLAAMEIESVIARRAKSLLADLKLFDVYEGKNIPEGKRSLAYTMTFNAQDRTLTDDEVNQLQEKILGDLKAKLGIELRS